MREAPEREAADARRQLVKMERFGEVVVGAGIESRHLIGDLATCREHEHLGLAIGFSELPEHGHAVDMGEIEVEHDKVKGLDIEQIEGLLPVVAAVDAIGQVAQAACDRIAQRPLVLDDQDAHNVLLA